MSATPSCSGSTPGVSRSGSSHTMQGDWAAFTSSPGSRGYERATGGRFTAGRGRILQRRTPKDGTPRSARQAKGPPAPKQLAEVPEASQSEHTESDAHGVFGAPLQAAVDRSSREGVSADNMERPTTVQAGAENVTGLGRIVSPSTAAFGSGFLVSSPEVRAAFEVAKVRFAERQAEAATRVHLQSGGFR